MSQKELSPEARAARGKRLLIFGMFTLVVVTMVTVFLALWFLAASMGQLGFAIKWTLISGAIAIVGCLIVWFVYTKLILKE